MDVTPSYHLVGDGSPSYHLVGMCGRDQSQTALAEGGEYGQLQHDSPPQLGWVSTMVVEFSHSLAKVHEYRQL